MYLHSVQKEGARPESKTVSSQFFIFSYLISLSSEISRWSFCSGAAWKWTASRGHADDFARRDQQTLAKQVKEWLDENLTTQITYKIFQDLFNLNEKYISTLFKAEYNITPSRYVGELRLNMAKNLIQNNPELRVKDVAELVGFTDYFYFSRVFKSHEGVTPSQYIKVLMQDDVFRDFEKIPPLVEFSLQKSQNSCYTYKK